MGRLERGWAIIHLLALQVAALSGKGEVARARQVAVRLLTRTQTEGYIRAYLDVGEPMRRVLETLLDAPDPAISISYIRRLLAAFEQEHPGCSLTHQAHAAQAPGSLALEENSSAPAQGSCEPLSPQERRVLHLLVAGRTYAEIAQELVVSRNTIKTQVSSIYRKLGVNRRAEASAVARQLQLL
jgi:LuxR family maltose regulon positive regulatory protein